jgi:hypothetical protein
MALYDIASGLKPLDLGATLGRIDQMQASRAQMDAFRTQQQQEAALGAALPGALAGLTSNDPAQRNASLFALAQAGGTRGVSVAQPFLAEAQRAEARRQEFEQSQLPPSQAQQEWQLRLAAARRASSGGGGGGAQPDVTQRLWVAEEAARRAGQTELADSLAARRRTLSGQPDPTAAQEANLYIAANRQAFSEAGTRQFAAPEERDAFIEQRTMALLRGARVRPDAPVMQPPVPGAPAPPVAQQPPPMQGVEVVPPPERAPPGQIAGPAPGMTAEPPPAAPRSGPALRQPTAPEPTEGERASGSYGTRMAEAERLLQRVAPSGGGGYRPGNLQDSVAARVPFVGNYVMSREGQLYRQAQEDWVRAKLRKESGAAIGADEMEREIQTYFPMPGDRPDVIAQKQAAREVALNAMRQQAGRAAPVIPQVGGAAPRASGGAAPPPPPGFEVVR